MTNLRKEIYKAEKKYFRKMGLGYWSWESYQKSYEVLDRIKTELGEDSAKAVKDND